MRVGIKELNGLIKKYKNDRDMHLEFLNSDRYKSQILEPIEENIKFVTDNVKKTYDDYMAEIQKAIDVLEVHERVEQAKKQGVHRPPRRKFRTTKDNRKIQGRGEERKRSRGYAKTKPRKAY
jgi:hypothetical protein